MYNTVYLCQIVMKLEFSRQSFEKYTSVKFYVKSIQKEHSFFMPMDRQTAGRPDEVNSRFSQFANAPKK